MDIVRGARAELCTSMARVRPKPVTRTPIFISADSALFIMSWGERRKAESFVGRGHSRPSITA